VVEALAAKEALIAADVQGFVRVCRDGLLVNEPWEEMGIVLAQVDILKTDAVEAAFLTGEDDLQRAARALAALGPSEVVLTHADGLLVHTDGAFYQAGFYPGELVGRSGRGGYDPGSLRKLQTGCVSRRGDPLGGRGRQPQDGGRRPL
jgi:sugar/nucleoside kinase (ribokinase family)